MRRIILLCFLLFFPFVSACGNGSNDDGGLTGDLGQAPDEGVGAAPVVGAPQPPTNVTAIAGDSVVILAWNASATATRYRVFSATQAGGPFALLATVRGTSFIHRNAVNGTPYFYSVVAVNAAGASGNSVTVSATPTAGVVIPAPQAPTGLQALAGSGQVQLSWDASTGATSYRIFASQTSGGGYVLLDEIETTNFTHTGLTNGLTYFYVVQAVNLSGASDNSDEVAATPLGQAPPPVTTPPPVTAPTF